MSLKKVDSDDTNYHAVNRQSKVDKKIDPILSVAYFKLLDKFFPL